MATNPGQPVAVTDAASGSTNDQSVPQAPAPALAGVANTGPTMTVGVPIAAPPESRQDPRQVALGFVIPMAVMLLPLLVLGPPPEFEDEWKAKDFELENVNGTTRYEGNITIPEGYRITTLDSDDLAPAHPDIYIHAYFERAFGARGDITMEDCRAQHECTLQNVGEIEGTTVWIDSGEDAGENATIRVEYILIASEDPALEAATMLRTLGCMSGLIVGGGIALIGQATNRPGLRSGGIVAMALWPFVAAGITIYTWQP